MTVVCASLRPESCSVNQSGCRHEIAGDAPLMAAHLAYRASTTAFEAQQAAADVFNDGDPASAEALQGLSPNQAVLMLQAARVWLTPDQQADIDIAIQQIVTGTEPATSAGAGDS